MDRPSKCNHEWDYSSRDRRIRVRYEEELLQQGSLSDVRVNLSIGVNVMVNVRYDGLNITVNVSNTLVFSLPIDLRSILLETVQV